MACGGIPWTRIEFMSCMDHQGIPASVLNAQPEPGLSPDPQYLALLPTLKAERIPDLAKELWV